mmetsp:Transcript_34109/g.71821  ORF Transcript_34109/g.71821 Transcript_34109/m.71821 type:complete len:96 (+) Transcript_34109:1619-1906(+)
MPSASDGLLAVNDKCILLIPTKAFFGFVPTLVPLFGFENELDGVKGGTTPMLVVPMALDKIERTPIPGRGEDISVVLPEDAAKMAKLFMVEFILC